MKYKKIMNLFGTRPEAVEAGTAIVEGTSPDRIFETARNLLSDRSQYEKMAHRVNPYGDGKAAKAIIDFLLSQ